MPKSPPPPRTPRYNVREIQSINPTPSKLVESDRLKKRKVSQKRLQSYVPATGSTMSRRELSAREMAGLHPELVAKRPELLNRLAKRGVTFHIDPLLAQKERYGGYYSPSSKEIVLQQGSGTGVAAHETVHASMATSWVNPVRFLVDKNYRAARASDLVISGKTPIGQALRLYLAAAGGNIGARVQKASMSSEIFAIGAYGVGAYPGLPVDYSEAESLFGGSFEGR